MNPSAHLSATRAHVRRRRVAETLTVIALIAFGAWYGRFAFAHATLLPDYHYLAPAVMVATGQGFRSPVAAPGSPLAEFLSGQRREISREEARSDGSAPPNQFHQSSRYLILALGYWWRLAGISWGEVAGVAAALHVMAVLGSYAMLRILAPWPFAVIGALWICTSTLQLALVPHVRDYSKGAFIIGLLPMVVAMALACRSRPGLLATAGVAGAMIGFGLGFKMDVAVMAPIAIAAIVCFRGHRPWSALTEKAQAVGVLTLMLALAASPVLAHLSTGGSNAVHVVLLGYADGFNASLGIVPSLHSLVPFYSDAYVAQVVNAHHAPQPGPWLGFPSREYDQAGVALWLDVIRHFPADVLARAWAATNSALNLVFLNPDPSFLDRRLPLQDSMVGVYTWLHRWNGWGLGLGLLFVAVAAWRGWRHGALATMLLLLLGGYPSLQFDNRHYFHTQVIPVAAILLVMSAAWATLRSRSRPNDVIDADRSPPCAWRRAAVVTGIVVLLAAGPLAAARLYQSSHFASLLSSHLRLDRRSVPVVWNREPKGSWYGAFPMTPAHDPGEQQTSYYVLEFRQDDGDRTPIAVGLRYNSASAENDYSRVLTFVPAGGVNRMSFGVFDVAGRSTFAGIELGPDAHRRLAAIYRIPNGGPAGIPMDVMIPADWSERPLYQRLHLEVESLGALGNPHIACAAGAGCRGLLAFVEGSTDAADAAERLEPRVLHAPYARRVSDGIVVDGTASSESSYLVEWNPIRVEGGGALVLTGRLDEGGFSAGLLEQGRWHSQVSVRTLGDFVAVIPVESGAPYVPLLTSSMPPGHRRSRMTISSARLIQVAIPATEEH